MAEDEKEELSRMSLVEHLDELRRRLTYALMGLAVGLAVALGFGKSILGLLQYSYARAMVEANLDPQLAFPSITSPLATYLGVGLAFGIVIASPWIFYQFWMFVSAGLYRKERRFVIKAVPFSAALFLGGVAFFLFVASESLIRFFVRINQWLGYKPVIMLRDHIRFMIRLMLVFGLAFQTPIVVFLLAKVGLVSVQRLNKYRRHVIVGILIFAAVLTPPDPFSQLALAIPMWLLYELGILLAWIALRRAAARAEEAVDEEDA